MRRESQKASEREKYDEALNKFEIRFRKEAPGSEESVHFWESRTGSPITFEMPNGRDTRG
jgi:hypothetical protein